MKPRKKATLLVLAISAIVFLWVLPGINEGKHKGYARSYEDTEGKPAGPLMQTAYHKSDTTQKRQRRIMKREVIDPGKSKKVNAWMFSRAMQFEPLHEGDSLPVEHEMDSLFVVR